MSRSFQAALVDNRLRFCTADRARSRSLTIAKIIPALRFAGGQPAVCGLWHVLQALKDVWPTSVDGSTVKLTPIPSERHVQLIGFNVQFTGRTTPFRAFPDAISHA
jgi:hypothetical protein